MTRDIVAALTPASRAVLSIVQPRMATHADRATLYRRVRSRAARRHWSHFDTLSGQDTLETWHTPDFAAEEPPSIDVPVLWVDTAHDYSPTLPQITNWLHRNI